MENRILSLYKAKSTVFTAKEIGLIWGEGNLNQLKSALKYYVDKGELRRIRRGIYAKPEYEPLEAATKIYTPAYISFETVLRREGVIFQYYETIFAASYLSREIEIKGAQKIIYRKMKKNILLEKKGVREEDGYFIADKERAFLDMLYINPNYYFDNLGNIDWKKCFDLAPLYESEKIKERITFYKKNYV
jgi:predicted transcriptional regulator of viral defense system